MISITTSTTTTTKSRYRSIGIKDSGGNIVGRQMRFLELTNENFSHKVEFLRITTFLH